MQHGYGAISGIGACVTFVAIQLYRSQIVPYLMHRGIMCFILQELSLHSFLYLISSSSSMKFIRTGFQYLPVAQMFVAVCPMYQEGVAFALLTSITNVAQAIATTIANICSLSGLLTSKILKSAS
ncbi:putative biopterin transporter family [Plasmopara halstedii]